MRLVMFDEFVPGALRGDQVVDLRPGLGAIASRPWDERMTGLIEAYDALRDSLTHLAQSGPGIPIANVRLRAPNPRPRKILCAIGNYVKEGGERPSFLDFFFKSPESVIGNGDTVELPDVEASEYQCEATLAVVIGKPARNIAEAAGLSYVFGYTALIDVMGKNVGRPVGTYWAKSFDTFGPMGPCIVTYDELPDPHGLEVQLAVNGHVRQHYATNAMAYQIPGQVTAGSGIITLNPGDMLGCGSDQKDLVQLNDGDVVTMSVSGIGELSVKVRDPQKRTWPREVAVRPSGFPGSPAQGGVQR